MANYFDEIQLPPKISAGATGGPRFSTTVIMADSGREQRNAQWVNGRLHWQFTLEESSLNLTAQFIAFFRARKGRLRGFRWKDWTDYKATNEVLNNTLTSTLQLQKTYSDAYGSEVRTILKPVAGTVTMTKNGVAFVAFTLDTTTGIVTLTGGAQAGTFAWSGEFDVPVRFDMDDLHMSIDNATNRTFDSVSVIEIVN